MCFMERVVGVDGSMLKLLLLRHGPVKVPAGLCYGRLDVPHREPSAHWIGVARSFIQGYVGPQGRGQSSPSTRALALAQQLAPASQPVPVDPRWQELDFGHFEGRLWSEIPPEESLPWTENAACAPCPGGESFAQLQNRVRQCLGDWQKSQQSQWVVCHGGPIRAVLQQVLGLPWEKVFDYPVDYASFTGLCLKNGTMELEFTNRVLPGYEAEVHP